MLENFHFLRPFWLLAIPIVWWMIFKLNKKLWNSGNWEQAVEPHLLSFLVTNPTAQKRKPLPWFLGFLGILLFTVLAGPVWKKLPQPLLQKSFARVLVLDLSYSMLATDLKPNRIERARFKLKDLLGHFAEGETALIAYAGEAFVISPLTHDPATIAALLPGLHPDIMPVLGSHAEKAIELAIELLNRNQINSGHIIWVTDGIEGVDPEIISNLVGNNRLSILGIGSEEGSPIPLSKGGFLKDSKGAIVISKLDVNSLNQLANQNQGSFSLLQPGDGDIEKIIASEKAKYEFIEDQQKRTSDQWHEESPWLLLILLPLIAFLFRRGLLFCWIVFSMSLVLTQPVKVFAFDWNDLWKRSDQQAAEYLQQGQLEKAEQHFVDPDWKGTAAYRSGNFQKAVEQFSKTTKNNSEYNLGNALARTGKLEQAVEAFDKALQNNPEHEDALFNKELIEKILQQQKQQQQQSEDQNPENQENDQNQQQKNEKKSSEKNQQQKQDQENNEGQAQQNESDDLNKEEQKAKEEAQKKENEQQDQSEAKAKQTEEEAKEKAEKSQSELESKRDLTPKEQAEEQALQQWLRKIPDDPGRLLRNKMRLEYQRRGTPQIENKQYW